MIFTHQIRIGFHHCDPAGIVFFPRYYEMLNTVVETFFREVLAFPFENVVGSGQGVPTVRVETDFRAASRLGEVVVFSLRVVGVGRSSIDLALRGDCGGELRLASRHRLVWIGPDWRAAPIPADIRATLSACQEPEEVSHP